MAMEELQGLLDRCWAADVVRFDPLNNHIQCYAHIINICSSHIIASFTLVHNSYLTRLKVPLDPSYGTCHSLGSDAGSSCSDDGNNSDDDQDYEFKVPDHYNHGDGSDIRDWINGIKCDPLRHA